MAFPTTGILDDFNRTSSLNMGTSWTSSVFGSGSLEIALNTVCRSTGSGYSGNRWAGGTYGPDSEVYIEFAAIGGGYEILARVTNPGAGATDGYSLFGNDTAGVHSLNRYDNGTPTQLGGTFTQTLSAGDMVGLEISGSTLAAYYKASGGAWTQLATRTDGTYTGAGLLGLESATTAQTITNFFGGAITGAFAGFTNTAVPSVTGSLSVGATLTANPGTWTPTPGSYVYSWHRADDASATNDVDIGASGATYTLAAADSGKYIRAGVYPQP